MTVYTETRWFNASTPVGVYIHGSRDLGELIEWCRRMVLHPDHPEDIIVCSGDRVAAIVLVDGPTVYLPGFEPARHAA